MILYDINHEGVTPSAMELNNISLDDNMLRGYLPKMDLEMLINQEDCVGVRLYKAINLSTNESSLVALGVKTDGFELTARANEFKQSKAARTSTNFMNISELDADDLTSRTAATNAIGILDFTAFFSKTMIDQLLADDNTIGVRFYEINLSVIEDNKLPDHISIIKNGLKSLMGVAVSLNNGNLENQAINRASDLPCPGHCLSFVPVRDVMPNTSLGFLSSSAPYLVPWQ